MATTAALVSGVLADGLVALADQTFSVRNTITPDGVVRPTVATRSGGPGSLVGWDTLGREGRVFTGRGSSAADIAALTGRSARKPVRAYAGIESAESTEDRAALTVADLESVFGRPAESPGRLVVVPDDADLLTDPEIMEGLDRIVRRWSGCWSPPAATRCCRCTATGSAARCRSCAPRTWRGHRRRRGSCSTSMVSPCRTAICER